MQITYASLSLRMDVDDCISPKVILKTNGSQYNVFISVVIGLLLWPQWSFTILAMNGFPAGKAMFCVDSYICKVEQFKDWAEYSENAGITVPMRMVSKKALNSLRRQREDAIVRLLEQVDKSPVGWGNQISRVWRGRWWITWRLCYLLPQGIARVNIPLRRRSVTDAEHICDTLNNSSLSQKITNPC